MFAAPQTPSSTAQNSGPYSTTINQGALLTPLEFNNTLTHPTGPDHQFLAGEGAYVLRSDLHLAAPPPLIPEGPATNANPPATAVYPPRTGTKLSLISTAPRKALLRPPKEAAVFNGPLQSVQSNGSRELQSRERNSGDSDRVEGGSDNSSTQHSVDAANGLAGSEAGAAPAFGESNALLTGPPAKDALKRRKTKSNIVKSNSSFVSRVIPHEALAKKLQERKPDGLFAFANIGRAMQWLDMSSASAGEPLTKLLFSKAHPLCHDVNRLTKSPTCLDVVLGFSTGDILWYEPMSQKYARINKKEIVTSSPVTDIRWVPGSENLFLAAHTDGCLIFYDKNKEDAPFVAEENTFVPRHVSESQGLDVALHVIKSVNSSNQKSNPVACWRLSYQRINAFAFSPDNKHLAAVSEDGTLRVIDYLKEELLDVFPSYYGGLICVCWSPDGKYVLTGGQDDLVSIWSLSECRIIARCEGHQSWVTSVAFDPWRCDGRDYRFGSVGEDCRLLLWDFSVGMLHRPKTASIRHRGSISSSSFSAYKAGMHRAESQMTSRFRSNSTLGSVTVDETATVKHAVQSRLETARLPPVMSKVIDPHPLCSLSFLEDCIVTSCTEGHFRMWDRPKEGVNGA